MNCKSVRSQLLDLAIGDPVPQALADHLASCPACREHLAMLESQRRLLDLVPAPSAPDALWSRIESRLDAPRTVPLRPLWWSAAAAAVLVAVGLVFRPVPPVPPVSNGAGQGGVTVVASAPQTIDVLVFRHDRLQSANILNADLLTPSEQPAFITLAGGPQ